MFVFKTTCTLSVHHVFEKEKEEDKERIMKDSDIICYAYHRNNFVWAGHV